MGVWRVAETLARTGGFGVNVSRRRILETFQHFLEIIENVDSVKPNGKGFVSSVRVRLLHAGVRRRLLTLERKSPGYFDVKNWGVPINDLHCICTTSIYSTAIVFSALPSQSVQLSDQQITDYLALWRWVGFLVGARVDWLETPSKARAMMESVMLSELKPSQKSVTLANNIITAESYVAPLFAPRAYVAAQVYRFNGSELATALGVEKPCLYYRVLVELQCWILLCVSKTYPWLSEKTRERKRQVNLFSPLL